MSKIEAVLGKELTEILQNSVKTLALMQAENLAPNKALTTPEAKAKQFEAQAIAEFEILTNDLVHAAQILLDKIEFLSRTDGEINNEAVRRELIDLGKGVTKESFDAAVQKSVENNLQSPPQFKTMSTQTLKALLKAGSSLLSESKYDEAQKAFNLICLLNPQEYTSWIGYGHASYHHKDYDKAILAYYIATSLRSNTPWPLIWAANACDAKREPQASLDLLERAFEILKENPDFSSQALEADIKQRIAACKTKLSK